MDDSEIVARMAHFNASIQINTRLMYFTQINELIRVLINAESRPGCRVGIYRTLPWKLQPYRRGEINIDIAVIADTWLGKLEFCIPTNQGIGSAHR